MFEAFKAVQEVWVAYLIRYQLTTYIVQLKVFSICGHKEETNLSFFILWYAFLSKDILPSRFIHVICAAHIYDGLCYLLRFLMYLRSEKDRS